jgi:hypothetical protein
MTYKGSAVDDNLGELQHNLQVLGVVFREGADYLPNQNPEQWEGKPKVAMRRGSDNSDEVFVRLGQIAQKDGRQILLSVEKTLDRETSKPTITAYVSDIVRQHPFETRVIKGVKVKDAGRKIPFQLGKLLAYAPV